MKKDYEYIENIDDLEKYLTAKEAKEKIFFIGLACALMIGLGIVYYKYNEARKLKAQKERIENEKLLLSVEKDSLVENIKLETTKLSDLVRDTVSHLQQVFDKKIDTLLTALENTTHIALQRDSNLQYYKNQNDSLKIKLKQANIPVSTSVPPVKNVIKLDTVAIKKVKEKINNSRVWGKKKTVNKQSIFILFTSENASLAKKIFSDLEKSNDFFVTLNKPINYRVSNLVEYYFKSDEQVASDISKKHNLKLIYKNPPEGIKSGIINIFLGESKI